LLKAIKGGKILPKGYLNRKEDGRMEARPTRLREIRNRHRESLASAALKLRTNISTLARVENGESKANADLLAAAADHYNVSVDYILCRTDVEQKKEPQGSELIIKGLNTPGERIKWALGFRQKSIQEIADELGRTVECVQGWIDDLRVLHSDDYYAVAGLLRVDASFLKGETEYPLDFSAGSAQFVSLQKFFTSASPERQRLLTDMLAVFMKEAFEDEQQSRANQ